MNEKSSTMPEQRSKRLSFFGLWLAVPLVLGSLVAFLAVPVPRIGVVRLEGEISDTLADYVMAQLDYAKNDPSIRAVVLKVNSPGGGVTPSENLYFGILSFRESKPLIVSVDTMAASGGYYAASAGELIYAKPSSSVGNIGVVSFLPVPSFVDEEMVTTGPFKLFGSTQSGYTSEMEMLKQGFVRAVRAQRGDRLRVSETDLTRGELYVGMRAMDLGLIDQLGTVSDAVQRAANLAKVVQYGIIELDTIPELKPPVLAPPAASGSGSPAPQESDRLTRAAGLYYLYVNRAEVIQ
jgi:protease-4